ncbi:MAG: ABC transporter permease [Elusimicrobia bacterium]|nr:ABC transporter permease [Elusimicrobiota bacterium]
MSALVPSGLKLLADVGGVYRRNSGATFGLGILGVLAVVAIFADALAPAGPFQVSTGSLIAPGRSHPFGTDDLGRDVFSGVIYGARVSLLVGFAAAATSTLLGVVIGALAGFYGGWMDGTLMRTTEFFQVVPRFFLALLVVAMLGQGIWKVALVIGILGWPPVARLVRGEVLSLKDREFVQASRAIGGISTRILGQHILPNAIPPAIVVGSLDVGQAILLEAGLSFLGVGDPNFVSWGKMLNNAQRFLRTAWWMSLFPGLAVFVTVLAVNLVGGGLNDALNPRLRRNFKG